MVHRAFITYLPATKVASHLVWMTFALLDSYIFIVLKFQC